MAVMGGVAPSGVLCVCVCVSLRAVLWEVIQGGEWMVLATRPVGVCV